MELSDGLLENFCKYFDNFSIAINWNIHYVPFKYHALKPLAAFQCIVLRHPGQNPRLDKRCTQTLLNFCLRKISKFYKIKNKPAISFCSKITAWHSNQLVHVGTLLRIPGVLFFFSRLAPLYLNGFSFSNLIRHLLHLTSVLFSYPNKNLESLWKLIIIFSKSHISQLCYFYCDFCWS